MTTMSGFGRAVQAAVAGGLVASALLAGVLGGTGAAAQVFDTDWDGLTDEEEMFVFSTDPYNYDTDFDGLRDGDEVYVYGTNPRYPDAPRVGPGGLPGPVGGVPGPVGGPGVICPPEVLYCS